jgi:cobalt-zinc-cadmium resistance protein CzcA
MIDALIRFSLAQRFVVLLMSFLVCGIGVGSYLGMPIDAFPDVTNVQVVILTDSPGWGPLEVEKLISSPIERAMNGLPMVTTIRSVSRFGISAVTVVFDDSVDIYFARNLVFQRLPQVADKLPAGLTPVMGPVSSGMGEILEYQLKSRTRDLTELRTLQDWTVAPLIRTVPGITDVLSTGGKEKQYQVLVDPQKLHAYDLSINDVFKALGDNNSNVGGKYVERRSEQLVIRGVGMLTSLDDIRRIVLATASDGRPVYVRDVANVVIDHEIRQGAKSKDGQGEIVTGTALMLKGSNSKRVIEGVKEKLTQVQAVLPPDVELVILYDQSELVNKAVHTVTKALEEAGIIVIVILFLFLGNIRSSIIVTLSIPVSILICFIGMRYTGMSANLMSFGGLAIGIGLMVDASIVMVENIYGRMSREPNEDRVVASEKAALEVGRPVFFAITIIIVVFVPILTLQGMEGKMFSPLALTVAMAMAGSLLCALTAIPVISSLVLIPPASSDARKGPSEPLIVRILKSIYRPCLLAAWRRRKLVIGMAIAALVGSLLLVPFIGTEFMPVLDEGTLLLRGLVLPSVGLSEMQRLANGVEKVLLTIPEVVFVTSKIGRSSLGGDPDPISNVDHFISIKPQIEWKSVKSKDELIQVISKKVQGIPGYWSSMSQPIANRVDELVSGVKSAVAVKIYGEDLKVLDDLAGKVADIMRKVPGTVDLVMEHATGLRQLEIIIDREAIARNGLNVAEIQQMIEIAVGGKEATVFVEGERRFGVAVRFQADARTDIDSIKNLLVRNPKGVRIPLSQLATIGISDAPPQVNREIGARLTLVQCNVRGRDLGGFVQDCQQRIKDAVKFPTGYRIVWGGQFENQQRAAKRLAIVIPCCIFLVFCLLFIAFGSVSQALVVLANIPFSVIGGILAAFFGGFNLSVSAMVGFIALFGIAIQNGVVMLECFHDLRHHGHSVLKTIRRGTLTRLRPVLMTAGAAGIGLVPMLTANGVGSEVQKPLAAVVAGGIVSSTLLTLLVLPLIYGMVEGGPAEGRIEDAGE